MSKKKIFIFGFFVVLLFAVTICYFKFINLPLTVYYNDAKMYMINEPVKEEDVIYLPAKNVFVGIFGENNEIKFNREKNELIINGGDIVIWAGSKNVSCFGTEKEYSMPAIVKDDVFLIPMEFLDAFNLKAYYSSLRNTVKITGDIPVNKDRYKVERNKATNTYTYTVGDISYTYDESINLVHKEEADEWVSYEYDKNDNLLFYSKSDETTEEYTYDENGNLIYKENQDREWVRYIYDEDGNLIEEERSKSLVEGF